MPTPPAGHRQHSIPNLMIAGAALALAIVAAWQTLTLGQGYARHTLGSVWRARSLDAMDRGALFLSGGKGADFLDFIRAHVPADKAVVVPPGAAEFSEQNNLQFFLMPRGIPVCPCRADPTVTQTCTICLQSDDNYVPSIGDFPPPEAVAGKKVLIPNPGDTGWFHGLYVPASEAKQPAIPPPTAGVPLAAAVATDGLLVLALLLLGCLLALAIDPGLALLETISLAFPLGAGLLTWSVFLFGWAGTGVHLWVYGLAYALLAGTGVFILRARPKPELLSIGRKDIAEWISRAGRRPLAVLAWLIIGGLALAAFAISVGRGYSTYDGIANWALKGYGIALEHSIYAGADWGGHGLAYPQNLHIMIALFRMSTTDVLPGSKLIFPLFASSLILGCFSAWRRQRVGLLMSSLGALVLLTTPVIFQHATLGYANLPFATYLVLGTSWLAVGLSEEAPTKMGIGGLLFGLAAWTRPEGIGFSTILIVSLLASAVFVRHRRIRAYGWLILFLAITASWLAFSAKYLGEQQPGWVFRAFVQGLLLGNLHLASFATMGNFALNTFASPAKWGYLLPVAILLLIVGTVSRRQPNLAARPWILAGVVAAFVPLGLFYTAAYDMSNFRLFLMVSFDRAMFPAVVLLLGAGILSFGQKEFEATRTS